MSGTIADGRVRRGARNRDAIVDALFALVGEGELQPTAEQVAERAGVRVRTVFRHFDDMESLHAALSTRLTDEVLPVLQATAGLSGSLAERTSRLLDARARVFERIAPYKRSANGLRARYPFVQRAHEQGVREFRRQLLAALPELREAPEPLAAAFELGVSFEAWERLRVDQRLGPRRAREAMGALAFALLERLGGA